MRTVYEGLSLNPLTQYRKSGKFSSKTAEGLPLASETYYPAQRVFFYKDNLLRGQMSGNNSYIFCNDIRGSVRTVNFTSGALYSSISYSTDGTPFVKKSDSFIPILAEEFSASGLDMLFAGKEYDSSSSLYNFGYRDYAPSVAGFTSSDPIRDGINWYGYCAGDPVNFVDKWGLELTFIVDKDSQMMSVELKTSDYSKRIDVPVTTHVVSKYNKEIENKNSNTDITRQQKTGDKTTNPTQFPNGTAEVTSSAPVPEKYEGKYGDGWLTTDASQKLPATDGSGDVNDSGYFIHFTKNTNTNGCIGVENFSDMEQILEFYDINNNIGDGNSTITVKGGMKNK